MEYRVLGKTGLKISRLGFGGIPIQKVGRNAQENVRKSIESMTGLHVVAVNVCVGGVSFEEPAAAAEPEEEQ